ncbi:MAG: phosphoribosyltransferase family protein, partial [Pirellulales bacterium]
MRTILSTEQLNVGITRLADTVRDNIGQNPLMVVGVLTGALVVMADLIRQLKDPMSIGMVWASSYRGMALEPGRLDLRFELLPDIHGKDILLVDDIFDSGRTLDALVDELRNRGATRVQSLVLLRKTGKAEVAMQPDYVGFDIPDEFVVGYG